MTETVEGRALPIQVATSEVARDVARRAAALREAAQAIADNVTDLGAVKVALEKAVENDPTFAGMTSTLSGESVGHRIGVCRYVLMTQGMVGLIEYVSNYIEAFVGTLYPEHPYVWSEDELESAKAEAAFAVAATRAITHGAMSVHEALSGLFPATFAMYDLLRVATYQGQAMELQARISAAQLELIAQQAEVLKRFDEQDKKMERVNRWINRFSIVAALAAVAALFLQVLDVFHVIP